MNVCEIFASIQGESSFQGLPTVFVRLTGCNLTCSWCDTAYAQTGGTVMTTAAVTGAVKSYDIPRVCITGGEPLLQEEAYTLIAELLDHGLAVSVETNGSIDASRVDSRAVRIIDIKCPGSGMVDSVHLANLISVRQTDQFKFVIASREDFDYAVRMIHQNDLRRATEILLSPAQPSLTPETLAGWMLEETPYARLQMQLHRIIWPDSDRGV